MAGPYYDDTGRQIIFNNNVRPGRWREPEPRPRYYRDGDGYYYSPEGGRSRHHRGSNSGQQQPIIINNENFIDERQPEIIERPRSSNTTRVYIQEQQQLVKVRSPSPGELSYETRRALDELERLKKEKEQEELIHKMKQDLQAQEAKKHQADEKKKADEKKMKELAVEEWKAAEEKKKKEAKEKEEEKEKIGKEYMRQQLRKDGYTEEEIEYLLTKAGEKKKKRDHSPAVTSTSIVIGNRPIFLKVHKDHIDPISLDHYKIQWKWADVSIKFFELRNFCLQIRRLNTYISRNRSQRQIKTSFLIIPRS